MGTYIGWTNVQPLPNLNNSQMQSSRIFHPGKRRLGTGIPNGANENFEMMFFGDLTKNTAVGIPCFGLFSLAPEILHLNLENVVFQMNLGRWVYVGFFWR